MAEVLIVKITTIAISIASVIGNAMVCHVIVRLKSMKTSINYIILNLAIIDAISGVFSPYYITISHDSYGYLAKPSILKQAYNQSVILTEVLCKINPCYWFSQSVSPFLLAGMAYERYKAIVYPFSRLNSRKTATVLKWIIGMTWLTGLSKLILEFCVAKYDVDKNSCEIDYSLIWLNEQLFVSVLSIMRYSNKIKTPTFKESYYKKSIDVQCYEIATTFHFNTLFKLLLS